MIPFLTYPLALIGLATLPVLAAIYILRNRFRRRQVSSTMLWRFQVQSKSGGAKIHRLQLPLLFFLELLALLLLVIAATGPRWKLPQSTRPLVVILDDSFSMRAVREGKSAQARAREFLETLYRHQPPPSTRLILAGMQPRSLGAAKTWKEVNVLLADWKCWSPAESIDSALTLATELGKGQGNILLLTDHKPVGDRSSNPRLEWRAFGGPLDNFAIVNASRTPFGAQDRCLLEVANYSTGAHTSSLTVQTSSNDVQRVAIALGPHESQRLVFNILSSAPTLRATLAPDALAEDNEAMLLPPIRPKLRVQVALTNEMLADLVNRTLESTGLRAALSENPELVIHESDSAPGSNVWSFNWITAGATNAFTGPFVEDNSHPLASGISLEGIVWAAAKTTNAPGDIPVILAGNVPLLTERTDTIGRRHLTFNFDPLYSTLQNTPDFPILFWNLLKWRADERPGLKESNARLGSGVVLKTGGEAVTVALPDGTVQSFPKTGGDLELDTPLPGLYAIAMGTVTNNFSVNVLAADKSDLSHCVTGEFGQWSEDTQQRLVETSAVWVFGLCALGLLTTHLYVIASAKGAS